MCGILGIVGDGRLLEPSKFIRLRDTMRHRGPDSQGFWQSEDGRTMLGHLRLAIVDLSEDGHQPMHCGNDRYSLTFNGEIYNFRELRVELQSLGVKFRSNSDTEVLLRGYEIWGESVVRRLVGMFAFAIFDAWVSKLFLARDRSGEKPLFYAQNCKSFMFSSELRPLLDSGLFGRDLSLAGLDQYLAYGHTVGEQTMVEGVFRLPAGCQATYELKSQKLKVERYWDLPEYEPGQACSDAELLERLDSLLCSSVKGQLMADVPVGIMLSGGIDSSLVAAVAAKVSPHPVRTFNIAFPGHGLMDESNHAQRVADFLHTDHTVIDAGDMTPDALMELPSKFDEPIADPSMICTALLAKRIRQHATVAIGGDGCDELFGGYRHHQWLLRSHQLRRWIPASLRRRFTRQLTSNAFTSFRGRNLILAALSPPSAAVGLINPVLDESRRRALYGNQSSSRLDFEATRQCKSRWIKHGHSCLQGATRCDFHTYLCDNILSKVDRATMAASLESRAPWLDHRIIEFAFREVPDSLKATSLRRKRLPAELCKRYLPRDFDRRRKQGFSIPLRHWMQGPWGSQIFQLVRDSDKRLFSAQSLDALINENRDGRDQSLRLFSLAFLQLWSKEHNISLARLDDTPPEERRAA